MRSVSIEESMSIEDRIATTRRKRVHAFFAANNGDVSGRPMSHRGMMVFAEIVENRSGRLALWQMGNVHSTMTILGRLPEDHPSTGSLVMQAFSEPEALGAVSQEGRMLEGMDLLAKYKGVTIWRWVRLMQDALVGFRSDPTLRFLIENDRGMSSNGTAYDRATRFMALIESSQPSETLSRLATGETCAILAKHGQEAAIARVAKAEYERLAGIGKGEEYGPLYTVVTALIEAGYGAWVMDIAGPLKDIMSEELTNPGRRPRAATRHDSAVLARR